MIINIRNEEPKDYRKVEEVTREAFWNLYFPGCNEHVVIHNMRKHKDFIPELSFVIEVNEEIIGSIFYTRSKIITENKTEYETITFGPVSILPSMHRKGFGRKLTTHSIETATKHGYRAILTMGYPYHYEPYGFKCGKQYSISMEDGKYYKGLLVLPLYDGALNNISGHAVFSDIFDPSEEEIDAYDKLFEYKEKKVQDSQKEYELYNDMIDE